jgi:hypothetical protein
MSHPELFPPVLPVVSVLYTNRSSCDDVLASLKNLFGDVVLFSEPFPFDMTDYYESEMGTGIVRVWLCFSPLANPADLPLWKNRCVELEDTVSSGGRRSVNIDPGYLDHGKLVLASCKPAPDKIYMRDGVFAHTCLVYRRGQFHGPEHSFADFIDGRFNNFFRNAKQLLRELIKERGQ